MSKMIAGQPCSAAGRQRSRRLKATGLGDWPYQVDTVAPARAAR